MSSRLIRKIILGVAIGLFGYIAAHDILRWTIPAPTCGGGMPLIPSIKPASRIARLMIEIENKHKSPEGPVFDPPPAIFPEDTPGFRAWIVAHESRRCGRCERFMGERPEQFTLCIGCEIKNRHPRRGEPIRVVLPPPLPPLEADRPRRAPLIWNPRGRQ